MPEALTIETVRTVADLRARVKAWRGQGSSLSLVPTMGALHEGHLSLVRQIRETSDRVCVSLFVNPTQFGPNEDFAVYPRSEAEDAEKLSAEGAHLLFAPGPEEMYPAGEVTRVTVPGLGDILEGKHRPGFFTGVATVVTKLLLQALPDVAIFGEKDYQQLQVIRRFVQDLDIPVRIDAGPTVREGDGLALSSRNAYLSADERRIAPALYNTIREVARRAAASETDDTLSPWAEQQLLAAGFQSVDYIAVRDAITLAPWTDRARRGRVLAAAWLGRTRLIDNVAVG